MLMGDSLHWMIIRDEARAIRAEGERAIKLMQANQSPYCDGWER